MCYFLDIPETDLFIGLIFILILLNALFILTEVAVADSHKFDEVRHSLTLNYYRKKLRSIGNHEQANEISRFQQKWKNCRGTSCQTGKAVLYYLSLSRHGIIAQLVRAPR